MIRILLAVIALLIAALCIEEIRGSRARAAALQSALVRDSVEALHDTTREVHVAALHDSLGVFVRRVAQQQQRTDQIDRALSARRVALVNTGIHVARFDTVVRTDTVRLSADSIWRAPFSVRREPYSITGEIAHRTASNDSGAVPVDVVSLHVAIDSIPLQLRLSCQRAPGTAVQRGIATVIAPPWAPIVIGDVEQEPTVCNPELAHAGRGHRVRDFARRLGLSVGAALISSRSGQITLRPALVLGLRIGP